MKLITNLDIYKLIKHLIEFPYPQICVHSVACDLLSLLEKKGYKINKELARTIVFAEDDISLKIIEEILTKDSQNQLTWKIIQERIIAYNTVLGADNYIFKLTKGEIITVEPPDVYARQWTTIQDSRIYAYKSTIERISNPT